MLPQGWDIWGGPVSFSICSLVILRWPTAISFPSSRGIEIISSKWQQTHPGRYIILSDHTLQQGWELICCKTMRGLGETPDSQHSKRRSQRENWRRPGNHNRRGRSGRKQWGPVHPSWGGARGRLLDCRWRRWLRRLLVYCMVRPRAAMRLRTMEPQETREDARKNLKHTGHSNLSFTILFTQNSKTPR